jgi:hypothetical protein
VKCATIDPYMKGEGPTFTVHVFDTGVVDEDGKVCAYELWQRDVDAKRKLLLEGGDFRCVDPTQDATVVALFDLIAGLPTVLTDPAANPDLAAFYSEHIGAVQEDAVLRFTPKKTNRPRKPRKTVEAAPVVVVEKVEPVLSKEQFVQELVSLGTVLLKQEAEAAVEDAIPAPQQTVAKDEVVEEDLASVAG